ncbi:MAG: hypothetical protein KKB34_11575 [Bacteroidetes bacterium]|jgi:hypothetical protein|nr:hypothetical protein [Bacteroidota bacterium]
MHRKKNVKFTLPSKITAGMNEQNTKLKCEADHSLIKRFYVYMKFVE